MQRISLFVLGIVTGGILLGAVGVILAWTGPESAPTGNNVDAPINVGSASQTKDGPLQVNGFQNVGHTLLSGLSLYLNFGDTAGEDGYGFRDNAGAMEFKDSGGVWRSLPATIENYIASTSTTPHVFNLYNGTHTNIQCDSAYGLVRSTSSGHLCQFTGSSCPTGWARLANWGVTHARTGVGTGAMQCVSGCSTGSHEFANAATESCTYNNSGGIICTLATMQATLEAVGCY